MSSMFFLKVKKKKKKRLGITIIPLKHHISPSGLPLPYSPLLSLDICYYHILLFTVWQRYSPPTSPCCEEICLPLGVDRDTAEKELSLVCHLKHSDEKKPEDKDFHPPLPLSWIERCMGKLYAFLAVLEDICSFQKLWQRRIKSTANVLLADWATV